MRENGSRDADPKFAAAGNFGMGVGIIALYLLFILGVFAGFSGYLSRVNLGKELSAAAVVTLANGDERQSGGLDELIYLYSRDLTFEREIARLRADIAKDQLALKKFEAEAQKTDVGNSAAKSQIGGYMESTWHLVQANRDSFQPNSLTVFEEFYHSSEQRDMNSLILLEGHLTGLSSALTDEALKANIDGLAAAIKASRPAMSRVFDDGNRAYAEYFALEDLQTSRLQQIDVIRAASVAASPKLSSPNRALLDAFQSTLLGLPFEMLKIPTILLTMIVTISAGGLGAVVSFTRRFLFDGRGPMGAKRNREPDLGRLLLNVGEGVAAAVAIFLFAGAGMLMLTQGGGVGGENVELSPYMVAFIAFVSGFMAEDAFAKIQDSGRKLFEVTDPGNGSGGADGDPSVLPPTDRPDGAR